MSELEGHVLGRLTPTRPKATTSAVKVRVKYGYVSYRINFPVGRMESGPAVLQRRVRLETEQPLDDGRVARLSNNLKVTIAYCVRVTTTRAPKSILELTTVLNIAQWWGVR